MQGIFVGSRADLERYLRFVETHAIEPIIDRVFDGLPRLDMGSPIC